MKKITYLILLVSASLSSHMSAQCLEGYQYPEEVFVPTTCDGVTENQILDDGYAGEYSVVTVTAGETYVFKSGSNDYITISVDEGVSGIVSGLTPLTWVATVSGDIFFYSHDDDQCGDSSTERVRSVICGTPSADVLDYFGLQFPGSATIAQGGTVTVYGQVYEGGLTNVEPGLSGQAAGIQAWVGVNVADTNPATWPESAWTVASHNSGSVGSNDEYMAEIGANLTGGTYYFATRFRLNTGIYTYGGFNDDDPNNTYGQVWNGTSQTSGVLNVTPTLANDFCSGAIALVVGATFEESVVTSTNLSAGVNDSFLPECQDEVGENVWFSVAVPDSGNLTLELGTVEGSTFEDSVMTVYSGSCGALTEIDCNDDGDSFMSLVELTGQNPGEILYVSVWRYNGFFEDDGAGEFQISAFDETLSTGSNSKTKFSYFPNPVRDVLTLNISTNDITSVQVYNILGQQVMIKSGNAIADINMSALAIGTYVVKVTSKDEVKTLKVKKL